MHKIKANGGYFVIYHQRDWDDVKRKPHICTRLIFQDMNTEPFRMWAVYYLLGNQSRIRCNLYKDIRGAINQVQNLNYKIGRRI